MTEKKWIVRSYHATGEKVEEFHSEAKAWVAAKKYLESGVAVATSGALDEGDQREYVLESGMKVDHLSSLDKMFTKW